MSQPYIPWSRPPQPAYEPTPESAECKLDAIEVLVRRHAPPGVNTGAHKLACMVLEIIKRTSVTQRIPE